MMKSNSHPLSPSRAGIGLRFPHHGDMAATLPPVGFLEIHPENYLGGGRPVAALTALRRDYPVSMHGVGLSLGSADGLDLAHLDRLRLLADRLEPALVSEHLSWSSFDGTFLNDLLPLPYTEESLDVIACNVETMQDRLRRRVLIENPSRYVEFAHSIIPEPEFLAELSRRTGCGLLLDVNNVYVTARNLGGDPLAVLAALPAEKIGEIHLAGHFLRRLDDGSDIRIDDHGAPVCDEVWQLYRAAIARIGPVPTLIEWDCRIPALDVLVAEAALADRVQAEILEAHHACPA